MDGFLTFAKILNVSFWFSYCFLFVFVFAHARRCHCLCLRPRLCPCMSLSLFSPSFLWCPFPSHFLSFVHVLVLILSTVDVLLVPVLFFLFILFFLFFYYHFNLNSTIHSYRFSIFFSPFIQIYYEEMGKQDTYLRYFFN